MDRISRTGSDVGGNVGEMKIVIASEASQPLKRSIHIDVRCLADFALGLFDRDPAVERLAELQIELLRIDRDPMLNDRNGGDVGQALDGRDPCRVEGALIGTEQVEGTDGETTEAEGKRMHGPKPGSDRLGGEARPPRTCGRKVDVDDRLSRGEALEARSLICLKLVQLKHSHRLRRRGNHLENSAGGGKHHPGGCDVEHLDTANRQVAQEIDNIEVLDQIVGQFDQGPDQEILVYHRHSQNSGSSAVRGLGRRAT